MNKLSDIHCYRQPHPKKFPCSLTPIWYLSLSTQSVILLPGTDVEPENAISRTTLRRVAFEPGREEGYLITRSGEGARDDTQLPPQRR